MYTLNVNLKKEILIILCWVLYAPTQTKEKKMLSVAVSMVVQIQIRCAYFLWRQNIVEHHTKKYSTGYLFSEVKFRLSTPMVRL